MKRLLLAFATLVAAGVLAPTSSTAPVAIANGGGNGTFDGSTPGSHFGFGVVFSDETLGGIENADTVVAAAMRESFARWTDIDITLDGRLLPGQSSDEFLHELRQIIGNDAEITNVRNTPSLTEAPLGPFFDELKTIVAELDPGSKAVPSLLTAVTDARLFARIGIPTYGFGPVKLHRDMPLWTLFHSADERIPVEGLRFGVEAIYRLLQRY